MITDIVNGKVVNLREPLSLDLTQFLASRASNSVRGGDIGMTGTILILILCACPRLWWLESRHGCFLVRQSEFVRGLRLHWRKGIGRSFRKGTNGPGIFGGRHVDYCQMYALRIVWRCRGKRCWVDLEDVPAIQNLQCSESNIDFFDRCEVG